VEIARLLVHGGFEQSIDTGHRFFPGLL